MKRHYRDPDSGATASITEKKDGRAVLRTFAGGKRTTKTYASRKSAYNAWYRMCN